MARNTDVGIFEQACVDCHWTLYGDGLPELDEWSVVSKTNTNKILANMCDELWIFTPWCFSAPVKYWRASQFVLDNSKYYHYKPVNIYFDDIIVRPIIPNATKIFNMILLVLSPGTFKIQFWNLAGELLMETKHSTNDMIYAHKLNDNNFRQALDRHYPGERIHLVNVKMLLGTRIFTFWTRGVREPIWNGCALTAAAMKSITSARRLREKTSLSKRIKSVVRLRMKVSASQIALKKQFYTHC